MGVWALRLHGSCNCARRADRTALLHGALHLRVDANALFPLGTGDELVDVLGNKHGGPLSVPIQGLCCPRRIYRSLHVVEMSVAYSHAVATRSL
eukprot:scaffold4851_cov428-Prasinococcus_capsulatus_cf.AAC.21